MVDFNVHSYDREASNAVTVTVSDQLRPLFDDEIDEMIKGILDDEPVLDQQHVISYADFPQVCDLLEVSSKFLLS